MFSSKDSEYRLAALVSILDVQKVKCFIQDFDKNKKKDSSFVRYKPYLHQRIRDTRVADASFNWKGNPTFALTVTLALTVDQA